MGNLIVTAFILFVYLNESLYFRVLWQKFLYILNNPLNHYFLTLKKHFLPLNWYSILLILKILLSIKKNLPLNVNFNSSNFDFSLKFLFLIELNISKVFLSPCMKLSICNNLSAKSQFIFYHQTIWKILISDSVHIIIWKVLFIFLFVN